MNVHIHAFTHSLLYRIAVVVSVVGALALPGLSSAESPSGKIIFIYTVEGMDGMAIMQPDSESFLERRDRVADLDADLLAPHAQQGFVSRRFNSRLTEFEDRFNANELTVLQRVGFSERTCSHDRARNLWGRGVDRLDHPDKNGWLARLAANAGWSETKVAWRISSEASDFDSGSYLPSTFTDFDSARSNTRQHFYDSYIREETPTGVQSEFSQRSGDAKAIAATSYSYMQAITDIRDMPSGEGGIGGYEGYSFSYRFRRAEVPIRYFSDDVQIIVARFPEYFEGDEDQRDRYASTLTRLQNAVSNFINNMKGLGLFDRVVLVLAPDYGRTIGATGRIPGNNDYNSGDPRGTACGHAGDVFIFGDATTIFAGFKGNGFSESELANAEVVSPQYTFTQLQSALADELGYANKNPIDLEGRPKLTGLFR